MDLDVAERVGVVVALVRTVDDVRARASGAHGALEAMPVDKEHAERAEREADARAQEARRELLDAERRLEQARHSRRSGEAVTANAEREVRRASVAAIDAAATVARARERLQSLSHDERELRAGAEALAVEAMEVAEAVARVPRLSASGRVVPGGSLAAIEEWGARAHAALFVVRGGLETERERIVLEANALATAALGEQVAGSSVALVRKRLEQSFA